MRRLLFPQAWPFGNIAAREALQSSLKGPCRVPAGRRKRLCPMLIRLIVDGCGRYR
jgi:hypothetical protein